MSGEKIVKLYFVVQVPYYVSSCILNYLIWCFQSMLAKMQVMNKPADGKLEALIVELIDL